MLNSINPYNGDHIASYDCFSDAQLDQSLSAAQAAFDVWRQASIAKRSEVLVELGRLLRKEKSELANLITAEMGKTIQLAKAEVEKCAKLCDFYAEHAADWLADQPVATEAQQSYVHFEPLGVILGIMPWNFPIWQVLRFGVPAMAAGNVVVLKHANNVTGCALKIEQHFQAALKHCDLPAQCFQTLVIDIPAIAGVIEDPRIQGVALTGSVRAGRAVGETAGRALKKCVLELGGSDPFVVLPDADLELAADLLATSRMNVAGQVCISPKRTIVTQPNQSKLVELLKEKLTKLKAGDPADPETDYGPLARQDLRDGVARQVDRSIAAGAIKTWQAEVAEDAPATFYPATILENVTPGMPAYAEEIFGPVFAILTAKDEAHAFELANDSDYGLGAVVVSRDVDKAESLARAHLDAGCCFVNDFVRSDPRLPFGGIKHSGFGRELGQFGLHEFTNIKTVYVA